MAKKFANRLDFTDLENEMPISDRWAAKTVYQRLCQTRDIHGERPAVSFQLKSGNKDKNITLSYNELTDRITQTANLFRSLGIGPLSFLINFNFNYRCSIFRFRLTNTS